jgi:hypothetical protein
MVLAAKAGDDAHLQAAASDEPLLLLASTMRHATLVHMAAQQGRVQTLRALIGLICSHGGALSARLTDLAARDDASPDLAAALKRCASGLAWARLVGLHTHTHTPWLPCTGHG